MWIRKVALRNSPVGCFNHRGFRRNGSESTTGRVGRRVAVRLWDCTSQSRQARALNGALALRNVPVARFNRRGLPVGRQPLKYLMVVPAAKRIHHRTGRQACSSAVMGLHQPIPAGARPIRRKERSFNDEIYQHGPFVTIYCRLRRYPVGARNHTIRGQTLRLAKSRLRRLLAGRPLRWVCSPYGIYGAKPCLSTNKRSGFIT